MTDPGTPTRRTVVTGAGLTALTLAVPACSKYGETSAPASSAPAGTTLAKTADIPVGGGKVFGDAKVVVTQPTRGAFKCFSAICTHQGCTVADVSDGTINCGCHGSKFNAEDGAVVNGPASTPLPAKQITVNGDSIELGESRPGGKETEQPSSEPSETPETPETPETSETEPTETETSAAGPPPLARTADIPVGGGKVFPNQQVVITQPAKGKFQCFSAICTHQGCVVADVSSGTINCGCHGSKFAIADGSVAHAPAGRPLPKRGITVDKGAIRLT